MPIAYGNKGDSYYDGSTAAKAAKSAQHIKNNYPSASDGIYWIDLPVAGPTQTYCLMADQWAGGGWMLAMKATTGTTFRYDSVHWTTATTLNETDITRNNADAKYKVMNYFSAQSLFAIFPDVTTGTGGSVKGLGVHTWIENSFSADGKRTTMIDFFRDTTSAMTYGGSGLFKGEAKLFSGFEPGVFTSQTDVRFYGFNYAPSTLFYNTTVTDARVRWGFGWNENGDGLYPGVNASYLGSNDVSGGIGMASNYGNYSAGDWINCCQDQTGLNRAMRVEVYCK